MSLVRIPIVNSEQLAALRTLLRLDFTRCVRNILTNVNGTVSQCTSILQLTDTMNQAEQPLIIVAAIMKHDGMPTAALALDKTRFELFSKLLATTVSCSDFSGLTDEQLEPILTPLKTYTEELKKIFESSAHIDEDVLRTRMKITAPRTDMVN